MTLGILNPSSAAIIAIVFGEYICRIIYHTAFDVSSEESAQAIPRVMIKLMAMLAVAIISAMHAVSLKVGTRSQIALTLIKMAALFAVAIMGIVTLGLGKQSSSLTTNIFEGSSHSPGRYALALYSGLWAFSGWAEACVVAGEMKEVERDLPKAIHISMGITTLLYLMANTGGALSAVRCLAPLTCYSLHSIFHCSAQDSGCALQYGRSRLWEADFWADRRRRICFDRCHLLLRSLEWVSNGVHSAFREAYLCV